MFRSLRYRNARLFFGGMVVSNIGTWLQFTALLFVVRRLSDRGIALGVLMACQFLPMLLLGLYAGGVADRIDKRRVVIFTQSAMGVQALVLGVLELTDSLNLPLIYALSGVLGLLNAFDNPARRGLATELADRDDLTNVMALNTSVMTGSRVFGPALAALLVAWVGTGWCFVLNGLSFLALLWSLRAIDESKLFRNPPPPKSATPIRDGLAAVWADPIVRNTTVLFAIVSTFAFNYSVSFPLLITDNLLESDSKLGLVLSVTSVGSVSGALLVARLSDVRQLWFLASVLVMGVTMAALSLTHSLWVLLLLSIPFGAGGAAFVATSNAIMAGRTSPEMRGRVLALGAVLFLGSTPIGGPVTGWVGDTFSATWSMLYGALISLGATTVVVAMQLIARNRESGRECVDPTVGTTEVHSPTAAANTPR
jgi:MFS family permease